MKPVPKVAAGGTAGAAVVVLLWAAQTAGIELPDTVANSIVALVFFAAAWLKKP